MIDVADIARPEPKRDRFGRYVIPAVDGKKSVSHTRVTTLSELIDSRYNLEKWQQRMVVKGMSTRSDLVALASTYDVAKDKKELNVIADKAIEASKDKDAAGMGTALHRMTEQYDAGEKTLDDIPEAWRPYIARYSQEIEAAGIQIHKEWIETVLIDDVNTVAGTTDRIVTLSDGRRVVFDLKTGGFLAWGAISAQLAAYAMHTAVYDPVADKRLPRVDVDLEIGLVCHLPQDRPDECTIYEINLVEGAQRYLACVELYEMRKRRSIDELAHVYKPINVGSGGEQAGADWCRERIEAMAGNGNAVGQLVRLWPADVPKPLPDVMTSEQVDAMGRVLDTVETNHEIPFPRTRPGVTL